MGHEHEESQRWRSALLDGSLRVLAAVAGGLTLAAFFSPVPAPWMRGSMATLGVVSLGASVYRKAGYRVRAWCLLGCLHAMWAVPLLRLTVATPNISIGFVLEAVLAVLLFDRAVGLAVVCAGALTLGVAFGLQYLGVSPPPPSVWLRGFDATHIDVALRVGLVAGAGSAMAVLGISHLLRRLERAIAERDQVLQRVEREHAARVQVLKELEQHEADFLRARELEVLGRLSSYVAHDFNNALLAIFGGADLLRHAETDVDRDEALGIVQSAAAQAASTVKQLRAFSPPAKQEPKPIDPLPAVRSLERILRTLLPKNIELVVDAEPTPAVCVDEGLLQSALMNLALNAWDAMREGGRLEIRIRARKEDRDDVVDIEVRDSGVGMDEATMARVWKPFYTTKDSHGTGLGLASVRQTIEAADGTVAVESSVGSGTCVRLRLPAVSLDPARNASLPSARGRLRGNVMVVDDDDSVRSAMVAYLRRCGLTAFEAQTRAQALQLAATHAMDVVVTDGIVSGASVAGFLRDLRQAAPAVRIVLCSGSLPADFDAARELADATLAKPFELELLIKRLRPLVEPRAAASA